MGSPIRPVCSDGWAGGVLVGRSGVLVGWGDGALVDGSGVLVGGSGVLVGWGDGALAGGAVFAGCARAAAEAGRVGPAPATLVGERSGVAAPWRAVPVAPLRRGLASGVRLRRGLRVGTPSLAVAKASCTGCEAVLCDVGWGLSACPLRGERPR